MKRLKALIAYDGTPFYGWQIQKNYPTIQATIEGILAQISRKQVRVIGAGRTDTGVHACGQVAHFDWEHALQPEKLVLAMNGLLPPAVRILALEETTPQFHARFDARSKTYFYRIDRNRFPSPFAIPFSLHFSYPINEDLLQQFARIVEGEHDFVAFQATGGDIVSTRRTIFSVEILTRILDEPHDNFLYVRIHATGFLRKMVRFLVGTMLEIVTGRRPPEHVSLALQTGERQYVGVPAPARGLFLERVYY